jgi:hypothetical protein
LADDLPDGVASPSGFAKLALKADPGVVKIWINHIEIWALRDSPYDLIPRIRELSKSILKCAVTGLLFEDVVGRILRQISDCRLTESFVAGVIDVCPRTRMVDEKWLFDINHPNVPRHRMLVTILREVGSPSHYRRLTEELNNRMAKKSTTRAVHATLLRYPNVFARVDLGVYGLLAWQAPRGGKLETETFAEDL